VQESGELKKGGKSTTLGAVREEDVADCGGKHGLGGGQPREVPKPQRRKKAGQGSENNLLKLNYRGGGQKRPNCPDKKNKKREKGTYKKKKFFSHDRGSGEVERERATKQGEQHVFFLQVLKQSREEEGMSQRPLDRHPTGNNFFMSGWKIGGRVEKGRNLSSFMWRDATGLLTGKSSNILVRYISAPAPWGLTGGEKNTNKATFSSSITLISGQPERKISRTEERHGAHKPRRVALCSCRGSGKERTKNLARRKPRVRIFKILSTLLGVVRREGGKLRGGNGGGQNGQVEGSL